MKTSLAHSRMVLFFMTFVALSTCLVYGQATQANLNGTVTDTSGASVPNSQVEVVSSTTGFKRQVETGDAGVYSITGLPIGTYDLTISHDGFKTFEQKGIALLVGQTRTVNAQLEVGAAIQRVEVQATVQALENSNAELGSVVQSQQVEGIPINGRDWAVLMALAPGAINLGRRPEGPAIRWASHRRQQLHLRWTRCHRRPGAVGGADRFARRLCPFDSQSEG